jgi:O-antigen/teichoic acid export membrane protein
MADNENAAAFSGHVADVEHAALYKSVFVLLVILAAQYCLSFITGPLIARVLGPTDRGRFTFFLTIPQWAIVTLGVGAPQAITYLVASRRFSKSESLSAVLTVLLTLGGVMIILALGFFLLLSPGFTRFTRVEAVLLPTLSFAAIALVMLLAVLLGLQRTIDYYAFQLLTPLLFFGVLVGLLLTGRFAYLAVIESYTAVMVLSCIVVAAWLIKQTGFQLKLSFNFWRPILSYGLKIYLGSILSIVIVRMDVFFVTAFLGFTALGYYSISVQLAEIVYRLAGVFATIRLPQTASRSKAEADRTFPAVSRQLILLSFLSILLVAVAGFVLIHFWLPAFRPSIVALLLLLPGTASLGLANLYFAELGGRGRAGYGSTIIALNSVVMILLDLVLIPSCGINGAAIASTLVYSLGFAFALFAVHRESGIRFRELLLVRREDWMLYKTLIRSATTGIAAMGSRTENYTNSSA